MEKFITKWVMDWNTGAVRIISDPDGFKKQTRKSPPSTGSNAGGANQIHTSSQLWGRNRSTLPFPRTSGLRFCPAYGHAWQATRLFSGAFFTRTSARKSSENSPFN
jgi:hypothetical protein